MTERWEGNGFREQRGIFSAVCGPWGGEWRLQNRIIISVKFTTFIRMGNQFKFGERLVTFKEQYIKISTAPSQGMGYSSKVLYKQLNRKCLAKSDLLLDRISSSMRIKVKPELLLDNDIVISL